MYLKEATFMINGCDTQAQVQGDIGGEGVGIMVTLKQIAMLRSSQLLPQGLL